jgi:integrase
VLDFAKSPVFVDFPATYVRYGLAGLGDIWGAWGKNRENFFRARAGRVAKRGGVKGAKLHKFRRTFAAKHAAAGTPIHTIQKWLGHRDIKTTLRYLEATASESEAAQKATEAAFGNLAGK